MSLKDRIRLRSTKMGNQAILLAAAAVSGQGLLAVAFILAARWSSPTELGSVVTAMAVGAMTAGVADFGASTYWVRELASGRMNSTKLNNLIVTKILLIAPVFIFVSIVSHAVFPDDTLYWTSGLLGFFIMLNQTFQVPLRGRARGDLASIVVFMDRAIFFVVFAVTTAVTNNAITALVFGLACGSLSAAVIGNLLTAKADRRITGSFRWRNPWAGTVNIGMTNIVLSSQSLDAPLLTLTGGPAATGIYGAVNKWTEPMSIAANSFTSAAAPYLARSTSLRGAWAHVKPSAWIPLLGCVVALLLAGFSGRIVELLLGAAYESAGPVLMILALASIPGILNQFLLTYFQYTSKDKVAFRVMLIAVAVKLGVISGLGGSLGALAAAIALATGQLVQLVLFGLLLWTGRQSRNSDVAAGPAREKVK